MGRSATTLRPAHAHTNAPRLINPWNGPKAAAAADAASFGNDDDVSGGGHVRPTPGEMGRGRPIPGKGTKSVGALWDLAQDAQKWAPPLLMASGVGKKTAYQKHPDVAATLECARAVALDKLRKKLNAAAIAAGAGAPPPQAFERWRFAATGEDDASPGPPDKNADPAVPRSVADGEGSALAALVADLTRAGVPADAARDAAKATAQASRAEAAALRKLADRLATLVRMAKQPGEDEDAAKRDAPRLARVSAVFRKRSVELSSDKGGHFVVLSRRAYGKLAAMYRRVASAAPQSGLEAFRAAPAEAGRSEAGRGRVRSDRADSSDHSDDHSDDHSGNSDSDDEDPASSTLYAEEEAETRAGETDAASGTNDSGRRAFHARLFALLLRYKSIQGYGFQSGVGPRVFATLRAAAGVAFEAFASPLNCYHTKGFCSAFPDVDAPFGARGDFFKLADAGAFKRGAYQVNPPFVSGVMRRVAETIERVLKAASVNDAPLMFVVFIPGWSDEWAWSALSDSRFLVTKFVVAAADHGYCDGAAHQRKASFRSSTYDTGVFALCSPKAQSTVAGKRIRAQNGAVFERDVREAFAGARLSEGSLGLKHVKHVKPKTAAAAAAARGGKSDEKKKRKAQKIDGDGGEKKKDETEKTEKKRENKAAKKRRKRREEKAKHEKKALSADAGNATKTETSDGTRR